MDMTPAFGMTDKLIDSLYLEAMVLADEARSYFDQFSRDSRADMTPLQRVSFSCESLKVTTRLMHSTAWLLAKRSPQGTSNPLAAAAPSETETVAGLPEEAQGLIRESEDLYARIQRLDEKLAHAPKAANPALDLRARLERAF
jgi:regulator of CtrA degradation